ncbi:MAG: preprotein translocase subunit SecG [Candidatus Vogelbacteria bacterium]|nr:preprotein translocase subunit SecG [Candidatus Vogelbacteria bacterium]
MDLHSILPWIQVTLSVLLVAGILMQQSEGSLGSAFGGGQSGASAWHTKRGLEKQLFIGSIVIAILFVASTILALFV